MNDQALCLTCGTVRVDQAQFCGKCGRPFDSAVAESTSSPAPVASAPTTNDGAAFPPVRASPGPGSGWVAPSETKGASWWSRRSRRVKIAIGVVAVLFVLAAIGSVATPPDDGVADTSPDPGSSAVAAGSPDASLSEVPSTEPTPVITPDPTPTPEPTPEPTPKLTAEQRNAIQKAESYLEYTAFSRSGLIKQLEFEGFTKAAATFAVDTLGVDWTEQAYLKGKSYLEYTSFSLNGLIDQLAFEGFTKAQAKAGGTKAYNE